MSEGNSIGVFGGTFDPIHNTHLKIARTAIEAAGLDLVLFVVSARPPHKRGDTFATAEQRLAMVRAAVEREPKLEASDLELKRRGPSYTKETLMELEREARENDSCAGHRGEALSTPTPDPG